MWSYYYVGYQVEGVSKILYLGKSCSKATKTTTSKQNQGRIVYWKSEGKGKLHQIQIGTFVQGTDWPTSRLTLRQPGDRASHWRHHLLIGFRRRSFFQRVLDVGSHFRSGGDFRVVHQRFEP